MAGKKMISNRVLGILLALVVILLYITIQWAWSRH